MNGKVWISKNLVLFARNFIPKMTYVSLEAYKPEDQIPEVNNHIWTNTVVRITLRFFRSFRALHSLLYLILLFAAKLSNTKKKIYLMIIYV